jgi:hypothetical protein
MSDIPKVKFRDMGKVLGRAVSAHQAIRQGIAERAAEHARFLAERDRQLNADQRVTRGK